jgi:4-nitrophenyl phosphatase
MEYRQPMGSFKAVVFDLDGTLYLGKTAIPGAKEAVVRLRRSGKKIFFLTNAATRSRAGIAAKLEKMGFAAREEEVIGGAYLLARYISTNYKGKKVYVIGERGISEEFAAAGIPIAEEADIVAVGLDRDFSYDKLAKAYLNLKKGAIFLASNLDHVFPTEAGDLPGAGSIVEAIVFAADRRPYVVGKPNTLAFEIIKKEHRLKEEEVLLVGDRLDTDLAFAKACGIRSCLVLTGNAKKEDLEGAAFKPEMVLPSVSELNLP